MTNFPCSIIDYNYFCILEINQYIVWVCLHSIGGVFLYKIGFYWLINIPDKTSFFIHIKNPRRSSRLTASLPAAIRLEPPKPGAWFTQRSRCKPIHSAAMRSESRQPLIASLREEKCQNRFKREKTACTSFFSF